MIVPSVKRDEMLLISVYCVFMARSLLWRICFAKVTKMFFHFSQIAIKNDNGALGSEIVAILNPSAHGKWVCFVSSATSSIHLFPRLFGINQGGVPNFEFDTPPIMNGCYRDR